MKNKNFSFFIGALTGSLIVIFVTTAINVYQIEELQKRLEILENANRN